MATVSTTRSAYPVPVEDIAERVRERLAATGAGVPSRNQIMTEFRVGAPKARKVLDLLTTTATAPTAGDGDGSDLAGSITVPTTPVILGPVDLDTDPVYREHTDHTDPMPGCSFCPTADEITEWERTEAAHADHTDPVSGCWHCPSPEQARPADPTGPDTVTEPAPADSPATGEASALVDVPVDPGTPTPTTHRTGSGGRGPRRVRTWPVMLIALAAFVAIWGGWVELGRMTGFGEITPLPGIADDWTIDSAITLPIGVEAYAALALRVWLSALAYSPRTRRFAMWSTLGALVLGMGGQVAYHLMKAAGIITAPWPITAVVSCLPVLVLGLAAALVHLMHNDQSDHEEVTR